MTDKQDIINAIKSERFRITDHAYEEVLSDNFQFTIVLTSIIHREVSSREFMKYMAQAVIKRGTKSFNRVISPV